MAFEPLRLTPRNAPTLINTLEAICEDVKVSQHGEALDFVLVINTDRRVQVISYGLNDDRLIIERLETAINMVRG